MDIWSSGIDFDLPGNGGPTCLSHTSLAFRVAETVFSLMTFVAALAVGIAHHTPPNSKSSTRWPEEKDPVRKTLLFGLLATYLAEIGYKAITSQFVFVVNPCHLLCLVHLYLLTNVHADSNLKTYVHRIHLFFLHGPLMAVIFPVTNTLFLPGEVLTYWVEHAFLLLVPAYLLRHYTVPKITLKEMCSWALMAYGIWGIYHYMFLQPLAILSLGNLNSVLCPAITDPFSGPYYRLHALWHQAVATMLSGIFWWSFSTPEPTKL